MMMDTATSNSASQLNNMQLEIIPEQLEEERRPSQTHNQLAPYMRRSSLEDEFERADDDAFEEEKSPQRQVHF